MAGNRVMRGLRRGPDCGNGYPPMSDLVSQSFLPERLTAVSVLRAYRDGFFPMACGDGRLRWFSPDPRGIMPLEHFHLPRGFRRVLPKLNFGITVNSAFNEVVAGCADRPETWIDPAIAKVYAELHRQGAAHSVEVWSGDHLAGGLYGVQLGGVFFGESMFSRASETSKVALLVLVGILRERGFGLLDLQWVTEHLAGFGGIEVRRAVYLQQLREAMGRTCVFPEAGEVSGLVRDVASVPRGRTELTQGAM